jgi:hypothetical protein
VAIRNNAYGNSLKIRLQLADYLTTDHALEFVIAPTEIIQFTLSLLDETVNNLLLTGTRSFKNFIKFTAEPLNVTGPVYVFVGLDTLKL